MITMMDMWMVIMMIKMIIGPQEMREEAFRRVGSSDNATIEGQITAAERCFPSG